MASEGKRMTKDELREDEFVDWLVSAVDYIRDNSQSFLIGTAVFVIIVVGINFFIEAQEQELRDAEELLGDVMIAKESGQVNEAKVKAEQLLSQYAGSKAALQSVIMLGNMNFSEDNYQEALRYYQQYLESDQEQQVDILVHAARMGVAACSEAEGNLKEAASKYEHFATENPDEVTASIALMNAARCYQQLGDYTRQKEVLVKVIDAFPELPIAQNARRIMEMM